MGIFRGRIEDYSSPLAGLPARLYVGGLFFKQGMESLTRGFGGAELHETLEKWAAGPAYDFYVPLLQKAFIPHAGMFAHLVTYCEVAIGGMLLFGCVCRMAALGGMFLCLNYFLASGATILGAEPVVAFFCLLLVIYTTAAGRSLGLDALLKHRLPRWAA